MAKKQQQMRSSQKVSMMRGKKAVRKENAFEKISSRKKFNVLGKKTKGDVKRTTQLRSDAVEKVGSKQLNASKQNACLFPC